MNRPSILGIGALLAVTAAFISLVDDVLQPAQPCIQVPVPARQGPDGYWRAGGIAYGWSEPGTDRCVVAIPDDDE